MLTEIQQTEEHQGETFFPRESIKGTAFPSSPVDALRLFIDNEIWGAFEFSRATDHELIVFENLFHNNVQRGIFRDRSAEDLAILKAHHYILRAGNSPVAGVSLVPDGEKWVELSGLWSGYPGNGFGMGIIEQAKKAAAGRMIFALTASGTAKKLFTNAGFVCHGQLSDVQAAPPFPLPRALRQYDISSRNPTLFTFTHC